MTCFVCEQTILRDPVHLGPGHDRHPQCGPGTHAWMRMLDRHGRPPSEAALILHRHLATSPDRPVSNKRAQWLARRRDMGEVLRAQIIKWSPRRQRVRNVLKVEATEHGQRGVVVVRRQEYPVVRPKGSTIWSVERRAS